MVIAVASVVVMVARTRSERARVEMDAVASAVTREARRAGKGVLGLRRRR
jgi:adenine-specific DNA methylase